MLNTTVMVLLILLGMILQGTFIVVEHKEKYVPAVFLKGLASAVFVLIGALASRLSTNGEFTQMIFIGLIFGMAGDILLNLRFVWKNIGQKIFLVGIVAFLTGHIYYLIALLKVCADPLVYIVIGAVLAAVLLFIIFKKLTVKLAFKIFGIVYIGAVVIMTVVAIGVAIANPGSRRALIYAIGAVLFTASDVVLIFNTFGSTTKFSLRITNLSLYYVGQIMIALSLFYV